MKTPEAHLRALVSLVMSWDLMNKSVMVGYQNFYRPIKFLSLLLLLQHRSTHSDTIDTGYCSSSNSRSCHSFCDCFGCPGVHYSKKKEQEVRDQVCMMINV